MKLRTRQKSKKDQALDAFASVAKTWSEWHLAERAGKSVKQGAQKASGLKGVARSTPAKVAGAIALTGGLGAIAFKKLKGGAQPAPVYTPPSPAAVPAAEPRKSGAAPMPPPAPAVDPPAGDLPLHAVAAQSDAAATAPAAAVDPPVADPDPLDEIVVLAGDPVPSPGPDLPMPSEDPTPVLDPIAPTADLTALDEAPLPSDWDPAPPTGADDAPAAPGGVTPEPADYAEPAAESGDKDEDKADEKPPPFGMI